MEGAEDFYRALPAFSRFAECAQSENYHRAPDDWFVVVADIESSTKAIAAGRYKAVNMVGAAVITSILNACPEHDLPYVFGGDGATLLAPPAIRREVERSLLQTRAWAREAFGLRLRVGLAPLADLARDGAEVRVAKYEMTPGNELAMFAGHGVELADRLVKAEGSPYRLEDEDEEESPNLEGLSCRWAPLETRRGQMLTLLVHADSALEGDEERAVYRSVIAGIGEILEGEVEGEVEGAPVTLSNLKYRWPPKGFWHEVKTAPRAKRFGKFLGVTLITLIAWWLNRTDKPLGGFDPALYRDQVHAQSDYRKFDDMLRMVIDCSAEQAQAIESFLAAERAAGRLCYGLHRSERALMTCLVFSIEDNRHVHFIDGEGGGYTLAAVQLKEQMSAA